MTQAIRVWTDNLPEQRFLEAILRHQSYRNAIVVDSGLGGTSILSIGSSALLRHPEQPVAMVLNADTEVPSEVKELRDGIVGYMGYGPRDNWIVALAVPKVDEWALADERIRREFENSQTLRNDRYNQAIAMKKLTEKTPFDVTALRRSCHEFRLLDEFLEQHAESFAGVTTRSGTSEAS